MYAVNDAFWLVVFLQRLTGSFHLTGNVDSTGIELKFAFRYELVVFPVRVGSGAWPSTLNSIAGLKLGFLAKSKRRLWAEKARKGHR